jgi:hypothetical protein
MMQRWIIRPLAAVVLTLIALVGAADAALEDTLYEKGLITKEEWIKAKADEEKSVGMVEEWKKKMEKLPILSDKFNIGVNVLQVQYLNNQADATPGTSDNRFFIRRAELITWGKVNNYWPRWHMLFDFGALSNIGRSSGLNSLSTTGTTTDNTQILREAYVDIVPSLTAQPYIDRFRIGQYRIPVGIEGSTSSGLIDFINRNYITQAPGASTGGVTGTAAAGTLSNTIDFIQERDVYIDLKSKPLEQLELDLGIMNGNGINGPGTAFDNNSQKDFFGRVRVKPRKDVFVSMGTIQGESTNLNSRNGGRGKGNYDRYIADFQGKPEFLPGFWLQGEYAWGHDAPPAASVALDAVTTGRGEFRKAWYIYGKYLVQSGPLKDWEILARYEQFDPSTNVSQDILERTTIGINYYFANLPPRIQAKFMINYEFRNRQGNGPGTSVTNFDEFGNDALLLQLHVRWF